VSYLLYCIFRQPLPEVLKIPDDAFAGRVFTANYDDLGAALSEYARPHAPPDPSRLLAYEKVVDSFYSHSTVIPMRYGFRVGDPYDAVILLRDNQDACRAVLRQLEGLAEMGIQVLLDNRMHGSGTDRLARLPDWFPSRMGISGTAFLDSTKVGRHSARPRTTVQHPLVENLCGRLHGSFVRHKVELTPSGGSRLLSLYFLVPCRSVEGFRVAARHFLADESREARIEGPRPPYNFVDALQTQAGAQGGSLENRPV